MNQLSILALLAAAAGSVVAGPAVRRQVDATVEQTGGPVLLLNNEADVSPQQEAFTETPIEGEGFYLNGIQLVLSPDETTYNISTLIRHPDTKEAGEEYCEHIFAVDEVGPPESPDNLCGSLVVQCTDKAGEPGLFKMGYCHAPKNDSPDPAYGAPAPEKVLAVEFTYQKTPDDSLEYGSLYKFDHTMSAWNCRDEELEDGSTRHICGGLWAFLERTAITPVEGTTNVITNNEVTSLE